MSCLDIRGLPSNTRIKTKFLPQLPKLAKHIPQSTPVMVSLRSLSVIIDFKGNEQGGMGNDQTVEVVITQSAP